MMSFDSKCNLRRRRAAARARLKQTHAEKPQVQTAQQTDRERALPVMSDWKTWAAENIKRGV